MSWKIRPTSTVTAVDEQKEDQNERIKKELKKPTQRKKIEIEWINRFKKCLVTRWNAEIVSDVPWNGGLMGFRIYINNKVDIGVWRDRVWPGFIKLHILFYSIYIE
jgi:hypothetical protein